MTIKPLKTRSLQIEGSLMDISFHKPKGQRLLKAFALWRFNLDALRINASHAQE
jgi:hypothetical protein